MQRRENARTDSTLAGTHRAILIDSTVPWEYQPATDGETFRFAAWNGGGSKADWLLPAAGFLEELAEIPSAPASASASYGLSAGLAKAQHPVSSALEWVGGSMEEAIRARCERISREGTGMLHRPHEAEPVGIGEVKLQDELLAGAIWIDDPRHRKPVRCELQSWPPESAGVRSANWTAAWDPPVLPPLAAKLFQESNLREPPSRSLV